MHSDDITKSSQGYTSGALRLAFYLFLNIFHLMPYSQSDSKAALGAIIACLLSEILAPPPHDAGILSDDGVTIEGTEMLNASEHHFLEDGLALGKSLVHDVDWMNKSVQKWSWTGCSS